jgi:hypothetical protein
MLRLAITLAMTAMMMCAGLAAWKADAMVGSGAAQLSTAAKAAGPIAPAACRGSGAHCPPGYVWNGNRCVPC